MNRSMVVKLTIVILVAAAIGYIAWTKTTPADRANENMQNDTASEPAEALPLLLDLGSDTCIPCKEMMPILADLERDFRGQMQVEFINVRTDQQSASKYGIRLIPTQIFFDAAGNELARHEGFISRKDILAIWQEHGIEFSRE